MKWRAGKSDGTDTVAGGVLWARSHGFRLWRIIAHPRGGYMVPGLLRWVNTTLGTRNERRRFATVYGARMAAEHEKGKAS